MNPKLLQPNSIKTRVTLLTLAIFVLSIWAISSYISYTLRGDMQRDLGQQHFQTVSLVADEINVDVQEHLITLASLGKIYGQFLPGEIAKIQADIENRPIFNRLFNSGGFVTGMNGTAIASFPVSAGRVGFNFMDRDFVANALKEGKSTVSKPVISKVLNKPVLPMGVPIHNSQGIVIGALVGVIELDKPNFLDRVTKSTFNKTGLVSVTSSKYRTIVSSSDRNLVMRDLPPPGTNLYLDRNIAGFEGYATTLNIHGQEQLGAVKQIPAAQWHLYSGLPSDEVLAPVRAMQQRILVAAILLTLLVGGVTWWMLRRELAPMFDTARELAHMADTDGTPQPLPVKRQDEIGELIGGFNRLLESLGRRETALQESEAHNRAINQSAYDAIVTSDGAGRIVGWNQGAQNTFGYTDSEILNQPLTRLMPEHYREQHGAGMNRIGSGAASRVIGKPIEVSGLRKDGSVFPLDLSIAKWESAAGRFVTAIIRDSTDRKKSEESIQRLAFSDPLTGLPNRRLLIDRLEHALAGALRHGHHDALMFIDMDDFKTLNDTLGHDKGDQLLQQMAARVQACVREGDTVARLGGDEFVVLLEELDASPQEAATEAQAVAKKVQNALRQPYQLDSHGYRSTASIGITLFGGAQRESIEEPLKRAELAMYKAKAIGRDNLRFFEPEMRAAVYARAMLEADLHTALAEKQFLLHYQAQFDGADLTGVEVLARWQHPGRGFVSPGEFIPVAEASGLILPLGHWVLQTACQQLALWALRPEMAHLTMAVNVSARQFRLPSFVQDVLSVLKATGANPRRLKLELTESLLLDNMNDIIAKMTALKASGVGFSLDDFGTGYSSLSYLKLLPLDQLKIDQGFVRDILTDPNDAAIAKMVIALAESMGLNAIAEGVETQAQREALEDLGCHAYQGYLFSKPLPIDEFEAFARRG